MKPVATITFHWGNNYGAVLQALALQRHLMTQGYNTEIVQYLPFRTMLANAVTAIKKRDFAFFKKAKSFRQFRKQELHLSKKRYFSNKSLFSCSDTYSAIIAGSDQIWNMSFTKKAEGKPTLSYYLNFAGKDTKRISYAASFGASKLDDGVSALISPELKKFSAISVREASGVTMLDALGIAADRVIDPTILLSAGDYEPLIAKVACTTANPVFAYILHSNQIVAKKISGYVCAKFSSPQKDSDGILSCSVYEWLYRIKNANFVVTNSFHGTVFALLFHIPFIAVAIPNSGMNDRITTLLEAVGLSDRFLFEYDEAKIDSLACQQIPWATIDARLEQIKEKSKEFLAEALKW